MESYSKDSKYIKRTMDKKDSLKLHAKKRCIERTGIRLNNETYSLVLKAIHGEKIKGIDIQFKRKQSTRIYQYEIRFGNMKEKYDVIYDHERDVVVTFLPCNNDVIFYHYTNWIGNVINLKSDHNIVLKLKDGELVGHHVDIKKIENNLWYIDDINKTLQLRGDKLYEF